MKNGDAKELYFIISYTRKEKEQEIDFIFTKIENKPKNIYNKELEGQNKTYLYEKVFKFYKEQKKEAGNKNEGDNKKNEGKKVEKENNNDEKKEEEIEIQFEIGNDIYIISFNIEDNYFYYDVELKKGNKLIVNSAKEIIEQNSLDYYKKFEIFLEALYKNKEEGKIDVLFEDTIKLYSKKKDFSILISLFIKIYNKKNLCIKLIKEFYKISKDKNNEKNLDKKENLNNYITIFSNISSEADNLIRNNGYDPIQFYGIILCYLNYFDYENFKKYFIKLYRNEYEVLYEILLTYGSNLLNPIIQDLEFCVKFIEHTSSKQEFDFFENSLNFILDTETFIVAIDKTKEKIVEKYKNNFRTIRIKSKITINKREKGEEMNVIIPSIESIINFSKEKEILLIYFTSIFWRNILKYYNEPNDYCINICFRLREAFKMYNYLVNTLFDDINDEKINEIKKDLNNFFNRDEYAFILDQNIINYITINNNLSDSEILKFIIKYDPYYKEDQYDYKRDYNIFDYLKFEVNEEFIETFKSFKFEIIFKENIINFLNKIFFKINNSFKFNMIKDLMDLNKISEFIIDKKKLDSLSGEKLSQEVKTIAKFAYLFFSNNKNNKVDFLEQKIDKLDEKISLLIYNELMRICQGEEYIQMKEFIYKKYLNNSDNIKEITSLIDNIFFESGLNYIIDIETFLHILDKNKENFFDKNIKSNKEYLKHIIQLEKYSKDIKVESSPCISGQKPPITLSDSQKSYVPKKESVKEILKDLVNIEKKIENKYIFNIIKNMNH